MYLNLFFKIPLIQKSLKKTFLIQRRTVSNGILLENTYFVPKLKQFWLFHNKIPPSVPLSALLRGL